MKIKSDFVTNSSSVSFVGWGITMTYSDVRKYFNEDLDLYDIRDKIDEKLTRNSLLETYMADSELYVLAHPNKMKDEQTLGEFKKAVIEEFQKIGIKVDTVGFHEYGGYDG